MPNKKNGFQFQKVRLKAPDDVLYKIFNSVSIPKGTIKSFFRILRFNYYKLVSIPKGTIKRIWQKNKMTLYIKLFQFQKVRLKV